MPRTRPFPILALAALCAALAATPARAAYAPIVALDVRPPTAGAPVSLGLAVTQVATEEATRSVRMTLPGFGAEPGDRPAGSRIGAASSSTAFGTFSGGVFLTEGDRFSTSLTNPLLPLVLDQRFTGAVVAVPGGRELRLDEIPGPTSSRLRVTLDALLAAPERCGAYEAVATLTGHGGERAERRIPIAIGGCTGAPPTLAGARIAGRTVFFTLAEPAAVRITARRAGTRRVRTLRRLAGRPGRNAVRAIGRGLAPGRWLVTVRASDADGATARTLLLRIAGRR